MSLDFSIKPPKCPHCGRSDAGESFNYTHNITEMADAIGVYSCLWRPEENGFTEARQIIPYLERGIKRMLQNHEKLKKLNPENGWGSYDSFLHWLNEVKEACERNPHHHIHACR